MVKRMRIRDVAIAIGCPGASPSLRRQALRLSVHLGLGHRRQTQGRSRGLAPSR